MSLTVPEVISRYFEFDAERDIDSIVALFADDATVIDEGEAREGIEAIRAWRVGPASKYTYTTEVSGAEPLGADRYLITGRLTGNFPGGTADLKWDFTVAGDRITPPPDSALNRPHRRADAEGGTSGRRCGHLLPRRDANLAG